MRESNDALALVFFLLEFAGFFAVSVRVWILRRRQMRQSLAFGWSGLLVLFSAAWLVQNALDLNSSWALVANGVDDIPPTTISRLANFTAWLWTLYFILPRLAKGKLD